MATQAQIQKAREYVQEQGYITFDLRSNVDGVVWVSGARKYGGRFGVEFYVVFTGDEIADVQFD